MPLIKVDYEIDVIGPFIKMETLVFNEQEVANLDDDSLPTDKPRFKSRKVDPKEAYYITAKNGNQLIKIFASATGKLGFSFEVRVTFTPVNENLEPISTPFSADPLTAKVGENETAILKEFVKWKKPSV